MISEESISTMSEKLAGLKEAVDKLQLDLELLEHHCEDYVKFLSEKGKCTDEFLSDYAKDIEEFIDDVVSDVDAIMEESTTFFDNIVE